MFFVLNLFLVNILYTIPCVTCHDLTSATTICFNCYYSLHFFCIHNNNCSTDLQTTIILFTRNVSSDKTDWILYELPMLALSCLLYRMVSSLMNALEGECLCLCEISINVNKLFIVICVFCLRCPCSVVVACLLVYPLFYTDVVAIFLFIRWSCKQAHYFCFWNFCLSF